MREINITITLLALTGTAAILATLDLAQRFELVWLDDGRIAIEIVVFYALAISLLYGNFVYQFTRVGYWRRRLAHQPKPLDRLKAIYDASSAPAICILIPSYKEEIRVLRQTIISAAVIEY